MDPRVFYVIRKLKQQLEHRWTLEGIADLIEVSPSHLQKLFAAETGLPPMAYLRKLRHAKAVELLEGGFAQIKRISFLTGFENESHFTRSFKCNYGVTPSEYRRGYLTDRFRNEPDDKE